jgi:hypothetical protein
MYMRQEFFIYAADARIRAILQEVTGKGISILWNAGKYTSSTPLCVKGTVEGYR